MKRHPAFVRPHYHAAKTHRVAGRRWERPTNLAKLCGDLDTNTTLVHVVPLPNCQSFPFGCLHYIAERRSLRFGNNTPINFHAILNLPTPWRNTAIHNSYARHVFLQKPTNVGFYGVACASRMKKSSGQKRGWLGITAPRQDSSCAFNGRAARAFF